MQESDKRERCSQNQHVLNINVGILGHVDSGKTSLAKALSTIASTAAFDKNPQSVERGITLDLGFSSVVCDLLEPSEGEGNSSFRERLPPNLFRRYVDEASIHQVQFTLVDCPGHASLIRTIIGGASIVDVMLLVIDVTKGIQTQTAECIVLGEVLARRLIVILNKVDLIRAAPRTNDTQAISDPQRIADEEAERRSILNKIKQKLRKVFSQTKWPHVTFLEAAAAPSSSATEHSSEPLPDAVNEGAQNPENDSIDLTTDLERRIAQKKQSLKDAEKLKRKVAKVAKGNLEAVASADAIKPIGMDAIIDTLLQVVDPVEILRMRNVIGAKTVVSDTKNTEGNPLINGDQSLLLQAAKKNFVMYVDHCFAVKGHGTVLTGTVTSGLVTVGDEVTLPDLQITKKVKSLQVFHESVQEARQGDRVGMCLTGLDPTLVERGIVCSAAASFPTKTNPIPSSSSTITSASLLQHFLRNAKSGLSSVLHLHSLNLPLSQSLAAIEGNVLRSNCFIAAVRKVRFYKQPLLSNSGHKYHITIGHNTCMGTLKYFSTPNPIFNKEQKRVSSYHQSAAEVEAVERKVQEASLLQLTNAFCDSDAIPSAASAPKTVNTIKFPFGFHYLDELAHEEDPVLSGATSTPLPSESHQTNSLLSTAVAIPNPQRPQVVYAIVQLDTPIVLCAGISGEALRALTHGNNNAVMEGNGLVAAHPSTILLASRFDTDIKSNTCRLAVEGSILSVLADWDNASSATASSTDRFQVPHPIVENTTKTAAFGGNGMEGVAQPAPPTPLFPPDMPITALHADLLHHHLLIAYRHIHWRSLPIFKTKTKALPVDKIVDDFNCIVKVPSQTDQLATETEDKKQGGGHNHSSTPTSHQSSRMPQQDVSVFVKQRVYCLVAQSRGGGTRGRGGRGRGATSTTQDTSEVFGDGESINEQKSDTTAATNSVEWGVIEGTYGQHTNKLRVRFDAPVYRRGGIGGRAAREVILNYNKFPYASHK